MIQTYRKGLEYVDNVIDDKLSFNTPMTWTITNGEAGTVGINNTQFFEGKGSLKITNNDPTTKLVVSSSQQNTLIKKDGNYAFTFRVFKNIPSYTVKGKVNIFVNSSLLDTQAFEFDKDNIWIPFVTDTSYSFSLSDKVDFTFEIDADATASGAKSVYIDGMMLYTTEREQKTPPLYVQPIVKKDIGYADYHDDNVATQSIGTTPSKVTINGLGAGTYKEQLPSDLSNLYSTSNNKIIGTGIGDKGHIRITFDVLSKTGAPRFIYASLDIGNTGAITIEVANDSKPLDKAIYPFKVTMNLNYYQKETFLANGGDIFLSTSTDSIVINKKSILVDLQYRGK